MTFILGVRCQDGLVLCSDSLEADGYTKKNVQKLFKHEVKGKWGLAFGCSGTTAACTNFGDRLLELIDDKEAYDRRGTERLIEATMSYMRQEYPSEILDVIIGLWRSEPFEARLYKAHSGAQCLSVESNYVCAGMDVSLARFLMDSILSNATVSDSAYIATFVTSVMKEKADGVGGPTQLLYYHEGLDEWQSPPPKIVAKIEKGGFINGQFRLRDLEIALRQFFWSRFPHEFTPAKD